MSSAGYVHEGEIFRWPRWTLQHFIKGFARIAAPCMT